MSEPLSRTDCPYCTGIPGIGAQPPSNPRTVFDEVLFLGPAVAVTPTIGMFVPGYLLAITHEHVTSFAALGDSTLAKVHVWLTDTVAQLSKLFGEYLIFEHGSGALRTDASTGSCVTHAHLHLMPLPEAALQRIERELPWDEVESFPSIARWGRRNYALLGYRDRWKVALDVDLPGQWIRRVVATVLGRAELYDWALYSGHAELGMTLDRLRSRDGLASRAP